MFFPPGSGSEFLSCPPFDDSGSSHIRTLLRLQLQIKSIFLNNKINFQNKGSVSDPHGRLDPDSNYSIGHTAGIVIISVLKKKNTNRIFLLYLFTISFLQILKQDQGRMKIIPKNTVKVNYKKYFSLKIMIFYIVFWIIFTSVVDPELFIPDPALNFPSSGSWQKFWIHADPDPTHIF